MKLFSSKILVVLFLLPKVLTAQFSLNENTDFTIAFGSCNKISTPNLLWGDILQEHPNVWIWGGDNIYADTGDMQKMRKDYNIQLQVSEYQNLIKNCHMMGTWDDHDYGINDGGIEFSKKDESQQLFLDFFNVPKNHPRRFRKGVYYSEYFETDKGIIKIIILDTRYHRTSLTKSKNEGKRYQPNAYGEGTVLGDDQWEWLERELSTSAATFNIVVSSIQLLSSEHGWESWGNFPHEVERFEKLIVKSQAKGIIILSGDRHISDFSKKEIPGLPYPLIDFTSSGLTHAATNNKGEPNLYRVGHLVNQLSFGLLKFNFEKRTVTMEMKGDQGKTYQKIIQTY